MAAGHAGACKHLRACACLPEPAARQTLSPRPPWACPPPAPRGKSLRATDQPRRRGCAPAAPVRCRGSAPKPQQPPCGCQPRVSQVFSHNASSASTHARAPPRPDRPASASNCLVGGNPQRCALRGGRHRAWQGGACPLVASKPSSRASHAPLARSASHPRARPASARLLAHPFGPSRRCVAQGGRTALASSRTLYLSLSSCDSGATMRFRRSELGALKCALRCFRRDEVTFAEYFMAQARRAARRQSGGAGD